MDALFAAYRSGARTTLRSLSRVAMDAGFEASVLIGLAESVFAYIEELSAASAEGYAMEQSERAGERDRLLDALADLRERRLGSVVAQMADRITILRDGAIMVTIVLFLFLLKIRTTFITLIAIIWSWSTVQKREREYYMAILLLQTGAAAEAETLLDALPANLATDDRSVQARARLGFIAQAATAPP